MAQIKKTHLQLNKSNAKAQLARQKLRPRKSLGQHFLEDPAVINRIIDEAKLNGDDVIVEIGSGLGALTIPILPSVYHVVAVEKDRLLIKMLEESVPRKDRAKVTFVSEDILKVNLKEIHDKFNQKIKILGNLPYNISTPVLEKLIANRGYVKNALLMFQYELAKRLTAGPKQKAYGSLTVIIQYYARVSPRITITRDAFYPKPKVDSMVLEIDFEKPFPSHADNEESFKRIVRAAFGYRRKTILNSLERGMACVSRTLIEEALGKCRIDPRRRPETLTIEEYIALSSVIEPNQTIP